MGAKELSNNETDENNENKNGTTEITDEQPKPQLTGWIYELFLAYLPRFLQIPL
jgi:hypothetical protein